MSKMKFGAKKTVAQGSELQSKLELIACGIAEEMISGTTQLKGQLSIQDKCNVLKTLSGYLAVSNKVEPPEELGGAFGAYRNNVATNRNNRVDETEEFDNGRFKVTANRGERTGDSAGTGRDRDGDDAGEELSTNVVPFDRADSDADRDED